MKKLIALFIFLIAPLVLATPAVLVSLGETQSLPLQGSSQVWIQDKSLLQATPAGSFLRIRGLKEGETLLKIGTRLYKIQIVHPEKALGQGPLQAAIKKIIGLRLEIEEGQFTVKGRLHLLQDLIHLQEKARQQKFKFQLQVEVSEPLQQELENYFQKLLEKAQLPPQNITFIPKLEMRLQVDALLFQKYQALLGPYGITLVQDAKSVDMAPTVKVEITVAEVRKGVTKNLGLDWPDVYKAKILSDGTWTGEAEFALHALEDKGDLKILASPNILCRSGKEAEFLAGGEFPIKIFNYHTSDIIWKRYGILLRVKPVADSSGRISLSIETEISTIDTSRSVDGVPGLFTNRVSSHFDLAKSRTIALSGLLKNETNNELSGLPGLQNLPILGPLFSSKGFKDNETELVIFVRPSLVKESEMSRPKPRHL